MTTHHPKSKTRGTDGLTDDEREENHQNSLRSLRAQAKTEDENEGKAQHPAIKQQHKDNAARMRAAADRLEKQGPKAPE